MPSNLFSPLTIRNMTLKNRLVVSPMQQYSSPEGIVGSWHLVHLGSRAVGGAALIITECTAVSPDGRNTPFDTGMWNDAQAASWQPIVQFVHKQGAKIAMQLWHAGGKGSHRHPSEGFTYLPPAEGGWNTKSASAVSLGKEHEQTSQALTTEEIESLKADFVASAKRALQVGFDAVELHAGHGYLFHQFYSALTNHRTDDYGGSFENRIRLLVETADDIRRALPADMPLLVRISSVDYSQAEGAWQLEDSVKLAALLKERGVDVITASAGGLAAPDRSKVVASYQVPFAEKIKAETGIITGAVGLITEPEQANELITSGRADLIMVAREFLRDPYFALHASQALGFETAPPTQYARAF